MLTPREGFRCVKGAPKTFARSDLRELWRASRHAPDGLALRILKAEPSISGGSPKVIHDARLALIRRPSAATFSRREKGRSKPLGPADHGRVQRAVAEGAVGGALDALHRHR